MSKLRVVETEAPSAIARLVEDYLTHCRARGLSYKTIDDGYGKAPKACVSAVLRPSGRH